MPIKFLWNIQNHCYGFWTPRQCNHEAKLYRIYMAQKLIFSNEITRKEIHIVCDIMPCIHLKFKGTCCGINHHHYQDQELTRLESCLFFHRLWKWKRYVPPKCFLTSNRLHGVIMSEHIILHNQRCESLESCKIISEHIWNKLLFLKRYRSLSSYAIALSLRLIISFLCNLITGKKLYINPATNFLIVYTSLITEVMEFDIKNENIPG